jgi:hypothetical protein
MLAEGWMSTIYLTPTVCEFWCAPSSWSSWQHMGQPDGLMLSGREWISSHQWLPPNLFSFSHTPFLPTQCLCASKFETKTMFGVNIVTIFSPFWPRRAVWALLQPLSVTPDLSVGSNLCLQMIPEEMLTTSHSCQGPTLEVSALLTARRAPLVNCFYLLEHR